MKRILVTFAALAALSGGAGAADLPRRTAPPVYAPMPVFTWTGFYIGGHAGYGFSDTSTVTTFGNNPVTIANVANNLRPAGVQLDREGFVGGGQIGFNYQISNVVLGVEADISYVDFDRSTTFFSARAGANPTDRSVFSNSFNYLGTVRGRLGLAFDRVLVYGTGGFAYGDTDSRADFFAFNSGLLQFQGRRNTTETGYAVGGGVEYALPTDNWLNIFNSNAVTVKAEYLYYDLGRQSVVVAGVPGVAAAAALTGYTSTFNNDGHIVRAGINYKFGTY